LPIQVKTARDRSAQVKVTYQGETATVSYLPDALSNREWREMRQRSQKDTNAAEDSWNIAFLLKVMTDWDVIAEAGQKPIPITAEALDEVPMTLIDAVARAIVVDLFPSPATESPSSSF
jgi:hypothetical protein